MLHDLLVNLLSYIRGIWRFRWWILGIAWAVSVAGWIVVAQLPDQYKASARVYVDTQSLLKPLLRGLAASGNERQRLLLVTKTLLSRPNLEKVMRMTDMDLQARNATETDQIIKDLKDNIGLVSTRDVNLYTISYKDRRPELTKLVVKSLLTIFVESNLGGSRKDQDSARQFLEQQIAAYEKRLEEAEARQAAFKHTNLQYLSDGSGYYAQLKENQNQLTQAELDLKIQGDRLQSLKEQMEDAKDEGGDELYDDLLSSSGQSSIYDGRISALESNLDELLLRYTDKHPDVVGTRENIVDLKKKREEELLAAVDMMEGENSSGLMNPVYQQLRLTFADAKANVAAKEAVVTEYKKRIEKLTAAVDKALKVETQSKQLNRDYGILKNQHQALMKSLESARMGHEVDVSANAIRFRIVEPPRVPPNPSGPNRMLLSSGVFVGGLVLGMLVAFLLSQLRPTFDDRRLLNTITDLPVLGSVGMVWTQGQRTGRKRRQLAFLFVFFVLFSVYGLLMAAYSLQLDWVGYLNDARKLVGI